MNNENNSWTKGAKDEHKSKHSQVSGAFGNVFVPFPPHSPSPEIIFAILSRSPAPFHYLHYFAYIMFLISCHLFTVGFKYL